MINKHHDQLLQVHKKMEGLIIFHDIDSRMEILLECDKTGGVFIKGYINGKTYSSRFEFEFAIDQSYLPDIIKQLSKVGS